MRGEIRDVSVSLIEICDNLQSLFEKDQKERKSLRAI